MINPFLLNANERLEDWKRFRKDMAIKTEVEKLESVAWYWSQPPLLNIAYDCDDPETWGTIWEMIQTNDWCRNSVAIGMEATLRLIGFKEDRLTLGMLHDRDNSFMAMVVRLDNDTILNYDWGLVTAYSSTQYRWLRKFRWCGKKYLEI